jgi:hypothetical protein
MFSHSNFTFRIKRSVQAELDSAARLGAGGDAVSAFVHLERAHILGQQSTVHHVRVHWAMFRWALRHNSGSIPPGHGKARGAGCCSLRWGLKTAQPANPAAGSACAQDCAIEGQSPRVRRYKKAHLLPAPSRTTGNHRRYGEHQLRRLLFIQAMQVA